MSGSRKRKKAAQPSSSKIIKSSPSSLAEAYDESVRPLIDLVDKLRNSGVDQDVSLPSVVVVGDQSAGKSSVLEAISGVQLPRGTGIVTRCALELRLKKIRGTGAVDTWRGKLVYGTDGNESHRKDLQGSNEVEAAVRKAQDALAGEGKGVSEDGRIRLEIASPSVPDLTLIDLPGITRVAVDGQPRDIGNQVKRLIKKYIDEEETIILCVIPCTSDIATTEALQIAQEVDREGDRTLGVLTRADQTGPGEEKTIIDIVQQKGAVKLKLGYTVVRCRSQKDIEDSVPLEAALKTEEEFFRDHEVFCKLEPSTTGIRQLSLKLTERLVDHIQACLPNLLGDVGKALTGTTERLKQLGSPLPKNKQSYLTDTLFLFGNTLGDVVGGDTLLQELDGHGHLLTDIRSCFAKFTESIKNRCPGEQDLEEIKRLIHEQRGRELPGFESFGVFESIARRTVKKFEKPAFECLDSVKHLVEQLYLDLAADQLERFSNLKAKVITHVESLFCESYETAAQAIETTMNMEQRIFTSDPIYQGILNDIHETSSADGMVPETDVDAQSVYKSETSFLSLEDSEDSTVGTEDVTERSAKQLLGKLQGYFKVVSLRFGDHIPMTIMLHLLTTFVEAVKRGLINKFVGGAKRRKTVAETHSDEEESDEEDDELTPEELLREDGHIAVTRKTLEQKKRRLLDAERELKTFTTKRKRKNHGASDHDG